MAHTRSVVGRPCPDTIEELTVRIVFASIPGYGHTYPLMPLALACAHAGHDVVVATGAPMLDRLPLPTFDAWGEIYPSLGDVEAETARRHRDVDGLDFGVAMFVDVAGREYAQHLIDEFDRDRPDLVIAEPTCAGALVAASVHDVPAAVFSIGTSWEPFGAALYRDVPQYLGSFWTDRGRAVPVAEELARAYLNPVPPTWLGPDEPPWPTLPIRTTGFSHGAAPVPTWLATPGRRTRAYITLGTVAFGAVDALRRAVVETAAACLDVLVAIGPDGDPAALGDLPESVHTERFIAQEQVLPLVDLVVHHGGTGTTLGALASGVPQVIMPQGADQFLNAARLVEVGAGRAVPNEAPEGAMQAAVAGILHGTAEREVAQQFAAEVAEMPAPAEVVSRLESLAETR